MNIDDGTVMAYVDGELAPGDAARVEAAMAIDPELAAAVARQRAMRRLLGTAYAPVLEEPVPDALTRTIRERPSAADNVVSLPPRATASRARWGVPQWAAMAASLTLGVAISQWAGTPEAAQLQAEGGALVAGSDLARGLERQLASAPDQSASVAVGLTFRDGAGRYCRSFAMDGEQSLAGLACREADGRWKVPVVMESASARGQLRQAATALPPAVLNEIDARIDGEPLDADHEREARDAGWR